MSESQLSTNYGKYSESTKNLGREEAITTPTRTVFNS
jgi:hypothetical protein